MGISGELYNLENCLSGRFQRVSLNEQNLLWRPVLAGVPQGSILGPLLFIVCINNWPNELKLYADDTSLFTIVRDKNESANILNNDLLSISRWVYYGKRFLIQILANRPKKCYFQEKRKFNSSNHTSTISRLKERPIKNTYLGILLDKKLNFKQHIDSAILKTKNKKRYMCNKKTPT